MRPDWHRTMRTAEQIVTMKALITVRLQGWQQLPGVAVKLDIQVAHDLSAIWEWLLWHRHEGKNVAASRA